MKKQIGKLRKNFALHYLGLTSLIIIGSYIFYGILQSQWNYTQKVANLEEKVKDTANFMAALVQESGLKVDNPTFARILRQTSIETHLIYSVVTDNKGEVVSSFLNQGLFEAIPNNPKIEQTNILKLIENFKKQNNIQEYNKPIFFSNQYMGDIRLGYGLEGIKQQMWLITERNLLKSLIFSSIITLLLAFLFKRQIYTPLQKLIQEARNVSNKSIPLNDSTPIIEQLQTLVQQLNQSQQQSLSTLDSSNIDEGITSHNSDSELVPSHHRVHSDLKSRSTDGWSEENIAKSQFLAMIGHELRTPLNAVTGMTGLLMDTKLNIQQREFVNIIRSSSENLLTMINNILDFAKIEANKLELEEHPFELGECIEEALRLFIPQASEKKLELAYLIEPQTPSALIGDINRLRQILLNLLSNAVKFTDKGEVVVYVNATPILHSDRQSDVPLYEIRFAVKDTGIGIPSSRIDRLFKSFSQVDASTSRKYGGSGLGLAISKRLTELMNGKMWVHSVEGKGSTFYFTIAAQATPSSSPANSRSAEEVLGGKRLLIVDDNVTNQKILTLQAQSWGMFTCAVDSGERALEWLEHGLSFDVAILDMNMPNMNGLTLARKIREKANFHDLPLIMLSSLGKPELSRDIEQIKFAAILTKPIQQAQLYNVLVRILTKRPIKVTQSLPYNPETSYLSESLPLRILVAEDVSVNQEVIRLQLEKLGYWPDIVSNGVEALQALRRQPYDVVLMDVRMPEMDGLTATYRIHQEWPADRRPRIIAMTADAMQGDREKCLEVGMNDYIAKPIHLEDLHKTLSQCRSLQNEPAINIKVFDALRKMAGKRFNLVIPEVINSYLQDSPLRIEMLSLAIANHDLEALRQAAHALRSASGQVGASQLANLCQEIEMQVRGGKLIGIAEKVVAIQAEYEQVCQALHQELDRIRLSHNN